MRRNPAPNAATSSHRAPPNYAKLERADPSEDQIAHARHVTPPIVRAGGPGRPPAIFSELDCLVSVGYDDRTAFADEAMASRGCRARDRAGNCAQRSAQSDSVTGNVERA